MNAFLSKTIGKITIHFNFFKNRLKKSIYPADAAGDI